MTDKDDDEYELEAPDPEVLAAEARRDRELRESAREAVDIDAIYREADRDHASEFVEQWIRNFRFRFQVKHLLVGTALVAIFLTVSRFAGFGFTIPFLIMLAIFGLYMFLQWEEGKKQAEADRKRDEMYAQRRAKMLARGVMQTGAPRTEAIEAVNVMPPPSVFDEPAPPPEPVRIQFSMKTLLIVMTGAAVTLGLIQIFGGATPMATILGLVAVIGLVVHYVGFEPPQTVVLGWWLLLALYVVLSLLAVVVPALA